ncbi:MAG: hypothetical protein EAZ95_04030 [Bacteroidetes bacterium]|nr:MAG: hypothetical protein EAZ95_04030 [Bacteroidota bacterium]
MVFCPFLGINLGVCRQEAIFICFQVGKEKSAENTIFAFQKAVIMRTYQQDNNQPSVNFTTIEDVCKDYPVVHRMEVILGAYIKNGNPVEIIITLEEGQEDTLLVMPQAQDWEESVKHFPLVKILHLEHHFKFLYELLEAENKLSALEGLFIGSSRYAYYDKLMLPLPKESVVRIGVLPCLKNLKITLRQDVILKSALPCLEELHLQNCHKVHLIEVLEKLNPAVLRSLYLFSITDLYFEKPKKKNSRAKFNPDVRFEALDRFVNLSYLNISYINIPKLPFSLLPFQALHTLMLNQTNLQTFPIETIELPALKEINLTGSPVLKKKVLRSTNDVIKLYQYFRKENLPTADRYALMHILLEQSEVTKDFSIDDLLRLLVLAKYDFLQNKIVVLCERALPTPALNPQEIQEIALVGKLPAMSLESVQEFLAPHGINLTAQITPQTQVICLGASSTAAQIKRLIKRKKEQSSLVLCFASQMQDLMHRLETPYLSQEVDATIVDNLHNLLQSAERTNTLLAYQIMQNGGMPPLFFEYLCLILLSTRVGTSRELSKLLQKYATPPQYAVIEKAKKIGYQSREAVLLFLSSPEFDMGNIIRATYHFFAHVDTDASFFNLLKKCFWQVEGERLERVLDYYMEGKHLLLTYAQHHIGKFPKTLAGNPRLVTLEVSYELVRYSPYRKVVNSLPNLQKITIHFSSVSLEYFEEEKNKYIDAFPNIEVVLLR